MQSLWGTIYAGAGNSGYTGFLLALGSGVHGPTNCLLVNNTLSNLAGSAFTIYGESNLILCNVATKLNASYAARPFGRHNTFRLNTWRDNPNRIWMSSFETATAQHPEGSGYFDYNIGAGHSQASDVTNVTFELNWLETLSSNWASSPSSRQPAMADSTYAAMCSSEHCST